MKPHLANATFAALPYQLDRHHGVRCNQDAVESARNRAKVGIAPCALNFGCVRVDREHLEPGVPQLAINGVGWLPLVSRNTRNGEAFAAKEFSD